MPIAKINDIDLYYELVGSGSEVVVFLNGVAMNTAAWIHQTNHFMKKHRVLLHDLRGQGKSTLTPENFTFEQHAHDLKELLDLLRIDTIHIVGVSYGAEVGMYFALLYPERLKSLTLGTAASESHPLLRATIQSWLQAARTYDGELFFNVMAPWVYSNQFYTEQGELLQRRAKVFGKTVHREWLDAFIALCENFLTLDITQRLHQIQTPTLIISGREDLLKPVAYGEIIQREIPNSELAVIEAGAHAIFLSQAARFNQLVAEFIDQQS